MANSIQYVGNEILNNNDLLEATYISPMDENASLLEKIFLQVNITASFRRSKTKPLELHMGNVSETTIYNVCKLLTTDNITDFNVLKQSLQANTSRSIIKRTITAIAMKSPYFSICSYMDQQTTEL